MPDSKALNPPKIAVKIANIVFVLGILVSILIIVYAAYRIFSPVVDNHLGNKGIQQYYFVCILLGGISATCFGLGLRIKENLKINLSLVIISVVVSLYAIETYLEFLEKDQTLSAQRQEIAKQLGISYDTRTKTEILDDLNDAGINVYPNVLPAYLLTTNGLNSARGRIYPLGGISNVTTIFGNEAGYHPIIEMDEYGFNNPKGLYKKNKVDIVLTGDSFTEGHSVQADESISAVLRKLGFNTISIGKGSNGPLIELAALKEYAEPLKPKVVLWLYYVNDLADLRNEMDSLLLRKYLNEDNFSQNLFSRQEEIDNILISFVQGERERERNPDREKKERGNYLLIRIAKLDNLRSMLDLMPTPTPTPLPFPMFKEILKTSMQMASDWGGEMYFVYLTSTNRYSIGEEHMNRDFVLRTATELDIPIIDIENEVFAPHSDPLSLFPFRNGPHYTAKGYRLVAEAIAERLRADGVLQ